jgi:benzoyl-CoA reductase/2-hydroxyglutaryl-CoA dehydratase subunit BcrC/BadD/HgdB
MIKDRWSCGANLAGCHTYNVEAFNVREYVTTEHKKPYIQIETDYSENDIQQIKVRIQAFLELMGG